MSCIPCEVILNPNWWFRNYGISFDKGFYLDTDTRIRNDVEMRRALSERFGLGEPDPRPRPLIGSEHVAGGFVVPALFGCEIRFACGEAPWPVPRGLTAGEVLRLRAPEWRSLWPMSRLIPQMDTLEREFGYVCGDFDLDGVLNTALQIRGQDLYLDFFDAPEAARHLFSMIPGAQRPAGIPPRAA